MKVLIMKGLRPEYLAATDEIERQAEEMMLDQFSRPIVQATVRFDLAHQTQAGRDSVTVMLGAAHDPFGYQQPPPSQRPPANPSPDSQSYATKTEVPAEDITSRVRALLAPSCDNDRHRIGMERALAAIQAYQGPRAPRPAAAGAYQSRFPRQASAPQGAGFNLQGRPRLRVPVCWTCNKVGHLYRDCPDKDKQDGARQHLPHAPWQQ